MVKLLGTGLETKMVRMSVTCLDRQMVLTLVAILETWLEVQMDSEMVVVLVTCLDRQKAVSLVLRSPVGK